MWTTKRRAPGAEALLDKLRARGWKTDVERDEILKAIAAAPDLDADDLAWLAVDPDVALRQAGLSFLKRFPYEATSAAIFPFLASKTESVRRQAMASLETLAGGNFLERLQGFLSNPDPVVVHATLDYLRKNPNERALPWIAKVLTSGGAPALRKKAFAIVEATASPRTAGMALHALDDDDEELRYRAVQVLAKYPDESHIGPLLKHCRNDSHRVQDAAIAALGPLLAKSQARNDEVLPLLSDSNPKVRELASRIVATQDPNRIADAFLRTFRTTYGPAKDRAVEALRELGPEFIRAFLERDKSADPVEAALAVSIAVTIRSPEAVPHCIRFLSSDDWWLRDRAAPDAGGGARRVRPALPAEDAGEPGVVPLGRRSPRDLGNAEGPAGPARGLQAGERPEGPAPGDPGRVLAHRGPAHRAAAPEDLAGGSGSARARQGRAPLGGALGHCASSPAPGRAPSRPSISRPTRSRTCRTCCATPAPSGPRTCTSRRARSRRCACTEGSGPCRCRPRAPSRWKAG